MKALKKYLKKDDFFSYLDILASEIEDEAEKFELKSEYLSQASLIDWETQCMKCEEESGYEGSSLVNFSVCSLSDVH